MNHYIDILLTNEGGINHPVLMNKVFTKLHKTIAHSTNGKVAVSFPNHSVDLGDILRIHGNKADLTTLMSSCWLDTFDDYVICTGIVEVPADIMGYRTVSRVTPKSPSRMRRRSVRKGWLTEEEALEKYPDSKAVAVNLPLVITHSSSNGHKVLFHIKHGKITQQECDGEISSYGLSSQQTIPWF